jgi:penicillin V acylase-like amidase (Ntn superfamily)
MSNAAPVKLGTVTLKPFGMGSGMLGMPGDFTPPSRFVRAVAFSQSALPSQTGEDAVIEAFHILNQFDIPKSAARENEKDEHGNVLADYTVWIAASDLKAKRYYFRTYENSQIRMVDAETEEEQGANFEEATVRLHSFSQLNAVCSFCALWVDESTLQTATCVLTELRV